MSHAPNSAIAASGLHRFDLTRDEAQRMACVWNVCEGLTDEQVAAIPRPVAWFTIPRSCTYEELTEEHIKLKAIFPRREAE